MPLQHTSSYRIALLKTQYIFSAPSHPFILHAVQCALHAHFPAQALVSSAQWATPSALQWMRMPIISGWFSHRQLRYWIYRRSHNIMNCVRNTISVENAIVRRNVDKYAIPFVWKISFDDAFVAMLAYGRTRMMWTFCVRLFFGDAYSLSFQQIRFFLLETATKCSENHKLAFSVFIQSIPRSMRPLGHDA